LQDLQEQSELLDRVDEFFIVDRLGDVDVAAEIIAALDFGSVIGRRQHDHGQYPEMLAFVIRLREAF
jgi:hypothetical protein